MSLAEHAHSPRKRQKLSQTNQVLLEQGAAYHPSVATSSIMPVHDRVAHAAKEAEVGISEYVSIGTPGFLGVLKKRYTDFLVNEVLPDGSVVHLQTLASAAVSQLDGNSKLAVSSKQNEVGAPSSSVPGSMSVHSPESATTKTSRGRVTELESMEEQSAEGGISPVSFRGLQLIRRLTCTPGIC